MLQTYSSDYEMPAQEPDEGLDLFYYAAILRKRFLYALLPFILVAAAGIAVAMLWPPTYLSEGKILVESQQIPVDLVRPTVTATAKERIQVIQQRVITRDNLLALLDKYKLYADQRERLSRTELLDRMRDNIHVEPIDLDSSSAGRSQTIALKVGFTDQRPEVATQVANELVTLFLNEDARNRTNRAMETTRFLAREAQRLEGQLASVEAKVAEAKKQFRSHSYADSAASSGINGQVSPTAAVRAELAQKRAIYSKSHPVIKRLEAQLEALQKMESGSPVPAHAGTTPQSTVTSDDALDALLTQRLSVEKNLEVANQKLAAARLGESLERDQFSERLQVIEQAIAPQKPIKPNRFKIAGLGVMGAVMAGLAAVFAVEMVDKTIRSSRDLARIGGNTAVVIIPYLSTQSELSRRKRRRLWAIAILLLAVLACVLGVHFFYRPLDELWPLIVAKYL
jgi:uncharacterized protein involved in exopolysaccharide biosynthesis